MNNSLKCQPPSGGCVLKLPSFYQLFQLLSQPPSGGCVLKPVNESFAHFDGTQPPSGGCVLKLFSAAENWQWIDQPPSGGCVLKLILQPLWRLCRPSRLQAAVC